MGDRRVSVIFTMGEGTDISFNMQCLCRVQQLMTLFSIISCIWF